MTKRTVSLAPRAEADLDRIALWIAEQGSPLAALGYVRRIRRFLASLDEFPNRGMDYGHVRQGLRILNFEHRIVIAVVVRKTRVEVERIFSGGQNWKRALRLRD
jgi:toxin ParE1/3/4